jgi:hypothetical protein
MDHARFGMSRLPVSCWELTTYVRQVARVHGEKLYRKHDNRDWDPRQSLVRAADCRRGHPTASVQSTTGHARVRVPTERRISSARCARTLHPATQLIALSSEWAVAQKAKGLKTDTDERLRSLASRYLFHPAFPPMGCSAAELAFWRWVFKIIQI